MAKLHFNTTDYEFSHGSKPRGRGSWAFFFNRDGHVDSAFWTPGSTTYVEAKKLVAAEARRRGVAEVFVGS